MAWPDVSCRALTLLYLRIELADRDAQLGTRFEHLGTCADESEVLIVRDFDHPIEHRIVEHPPPIAVFLIPGIDRRIVGFEPPLGDGSLRLGEVWTDKAPAA